MIVSGRLFVEIWSEGLQALRSDTCWAVESVELSGSAGPAKFRHTLCTIASDVNALPSLASEIEVRFEVWISWTVEHIDCRVVSSATDPNGWLLVFDGPASGHARTAPD